MTDFLKGIHPSDRCEPLDFLHRNFNFLNCFLRVTNSSLTAWTDWLGKLKPSFVAPVVY